MIDLETLANLAEVLGALTIIGGVLFAVIRSAIIDNNSGKQPRLS